MVPLTTDLQATCDLVLSGNYQPENYRRISYGKPHEKGIGASSPDKKQRGCGFKHGKCGKACGCRKKEASCHM